MAQDRADVLSILAGSSYDNLFTGQLINDGIGIFSVSGAASGVGARRWGREYDPVTPDLDSNSEVYISTSFPLVARVEFSTPERGLWLGDFPWLTRLVTKPIAEQFQREAVFAQAASGAWLLTGVSVGIQAPSDGAIAISDVTLTGTSGSLDYSTASVPVTELPAFWPGQAVEVGLHATGASASAFVYGAGGIRQELAYGGTDPGGMRFTGQISFPSGAAGPVEIGVDVVGASTLESPQGPYDATVWGIPAIRLGGGA